MPTTQLRRLTFLVLTTASLGLGGCATQTKQESGTQVGAVLGAVAGILLGNNPQSRATGAAIGAVVGGMVGRGIGAHLDEVDRMKAQVATLTALKQPSNATVSWSSDKNPGVSGVVTSSGAVPNGRGSCKRVTHIVNVNGQEQREDHQWCQKSDGSWSLA
jgi:surface antigen